MKLERNDLKAKGRKCLVIIVIINVVFAIAAYPGTAFSSDDYTSNYHIIERFGEIEDPTYDLTDNNDTEIILNFNGSETLYMDETNSTYFSNFWAVYAPNINDYISDNIANIMNVHSAELSGHNFSAVVVVWGYPDNFNVTFVAQENLSADIELFNYFKDVPLPQPQGFYMMEVVYDWTYSDSETEHNDAFLYFYASVSELPEGLDVDTSHTITKGSISVGLILGIAGLVIGLISLAKGCHDSKKAEEANKKILEKLEQMEKHLDRDLTDELQDRHIQDLDSKRDPVTNTYDHTAHTDEGPYHATPPVPELPSIVLLLCGLLILLGYIGLRRRKNGT